MDPLERHAGSDSHLSPTPREGDDGPNHLLTAGRPKAESAPSVLPFVLGQYRVVEKIGEGGMGAVYRALHGRLKKAVALKVLSPGRSADAQAVSRFEREMEAIGRLNHNNIVRATDAGEADGVHYLVMELIDGIDLARLVRLTGPLPVAAACELMRQAAAGLQYAHENGLVHRDVKPSNLLLSVNGELKITDFGLALLSRNELASGELTVTGQVMGTADYMAPEQWEDSHAVDIRADLYSLGCTLYTLLAGRPPFVGPKHRSALRKMAAHAKELVAPITDHRADVPDAVEELRRRLMAKEPADRPADPAEVARTLEPFCRGADLASLARAALARRRPDAPVVLDRSTETRNAAAIAPTPAAGRTITASDLVRHRRGRSWRMAGLVVGAGLLAAAVTLVICLRPWSWAPAPPSPADRPTTPVAVAAPEPERGGWQNLLAERPTASLWTPAVDSRWDFDQKAEILWVHSSAPALIRLGDTEAAAYKLQIAFRQLRWDGGVGVYFGGRLAESPGRFQLIDLHLQDRAPRLGRSVGQVVAGRGGRPEVSLGGLASCPVPTPLGNTPVMLEIEVREHRQLSVSWDGVPCKDLDPPQAAVAARQADDHGEFGIYCSGSVVTVSTARFQALK